MSSTVSVIVAIALLAVLLIGITASRYAIKNNFMRTRLVMSAFFAYIVLTLSISFWAYSSLTLPFAIPGLLLGMLLGYFIGVRTERQKLTMQGIERYIERFAHIEPEDVKNLSWWTVVNYYSIMGALVLINLVGFTNVILRGSPLFIIITSTLGAVLIGSILPYLAHLWSFRFTRLDGQG